MKNSIHCGFTLLEAIVSVAIFSLLMLAVAGLWSVCWRATERIARGGSTDSGPDVALRRLGQAVETSVYRKQPKSFYTWQNGGIDRLSFVTSMAPDTAEPSVEFAPLDRIMVMVRKNADGKGQLVMQAGPFTMDDNDWQRETVLLEDVQAFLVRYWSKESNGWVDSWFDDANAPMAVHMGIVLKGEPSASSPNECWHQWIARVYTPISPRVGMLSGAITGTAPVPRTPAQGSPSGVPTPPL